ncbi:MAG: hypothetical protein IKO72_00850 [Kiritimatiellae bacterium]|nr:hypothetical protein [Kiritimatiellia bacterium]
MRTGKLAPCILAVLGSCMAAHADILVDWSQVAGLRTYTNVHNQTAWEGTLPASETSPYQGITELGVGVATNSNAHIYFADGSAENKMLSYCGYIWNDSETTENWTFACCMDAHSKLFIDGTLVINQNVRYTGKTATIAISPGAHAFELRYRRGGGTTGATQKNSITNFDDEVFSGGTGASGGEWANKFGFGIDRQGRGSHKYKDYTAPFDSGNGALFTWTTNYSGIAALDMKSGTYRYAAPVYDYSGVAGLAEYTNLYNGAAWTGTDPAYITSPCQGITSLCVRVAYDENNGAAYYGDGIPDYKMVSYCGYIWNDSDSTENWTFACCMDAQSRLFIDGNLVVDQSVRKTCNSATYSMTPGAHAFEFRYRKNGGYSCAIHKAIMEKFDSETFSNYVGADDGLWTAKFGFAIDRQGRGTHKYTDYTAPVDTGDGLLFCVSTNVDDVIRFDHRPVFTNMTFAPNTTLDLNAGQFTISVENIVGLPIVTNGSLKVTGSWTIPSADVAAGAVLEASGAFTLEDGAVLSVADVSGLPEQTVVILRAAGGLTLPAGVDGRALVPSKKYILEQTSPTELSIKYAPRGLTINFK